MRTFVTVLVISSMVLSGCARLRDSRLNPGNWFGGGSPQPVAAEPGQANPLIPRETRIRRRDRREIYTGTPVDQITGVSIEPTTAGAIIRVTGVSLQQGAYDVRLISDTNGEPVNGVLTLRLMAVQPRDTPQGNPRQRSVQAGRFVSNNDLAIASTIRVIGARNERSARR
ncbi:hypothetical protein AAFO92_05410 [Roseovarius sp. CAU 1744]|uniref:hypothetical protein n=1 Tax=Roseovarius sp. CAU 1744 TaxID=3140368 RepID=UPI00325B37A6